MAKRKRLTPAQPGYLDGPTSATKSMFSPAPIAQVAGEASARAALADLSDAFEQARAEGRMVERLPLETIDNHYLVRDRLEQDADEMEALIASIRARGQQTPIEVARLPAPVDGMTHGLISGWRRLTALRRLHEETSEDRFATVRALLVTPETAQDAYVAMVEENEIRVNLSHYERARITLKAVREGVYPTPRAALQGLFGATTRSKRSKIGSFVGLVEAFDDVLHFPTAISEKLGLALARELARSPDFAAALTARLRADRRETAAAEIRLLSAVLAEHLPAGRPKSGPVKKPHKQDGPRLSIPDGDPMSRDGVAQEIRPGLTLRYTRAERRIELDGTRVNEALYAELTDWLKARG